MKVCSDETSIPKLAIRPSSVQDLLKMDLDEIDIPTHQRPSSSASRRTVTRTPATPSRIQRSSTPQNLPFPSRSRDAPIDPELPEFGLITHDRRRRGTPSSMFMIVNTPPLTKYQLKNGTLGRMSTEPDPKTSSEQGSSSKDESDDEEDISQNNGNHVGYDRPTTWFSI